MAEQKISIKVRLLLYHQGKLLLLRQTKPNGGNYTLVGGGVEMGENAKSALIRESFEEAGIVLKENDLRLVHVLEKVTPEARRLVLYFKAYRWEGTLKARETKKFKEAEWFYLDHMPANITGTVRHVLEEYRHGNMYSLF